MNKDKRNLLLISLSIFIILFLALFLPISSQYSGLILLPLAIFVYFFLKKNGMYSINKKTVFWLVVVGSILYIGLYYLTCLYFGAKKSEIPFSLLSFFKVVLPITLIIISIEIIRIKTLAYNNKIVNVIIFLTCVISEFFIYAKVIKISSINNFMDVIGFVLLPSFASNFLYFNLSKKYGIYPTLAYRLVTSLFLHLIPIMSNIPDALFVIYKFIFPSLFCLYINLLFDRQVKKAKERKNKAIAILSTSFLIVVMISIGMLISNKFKYGLLVIGSGSMTGELNKGDIIIYESYDEQIITEGNIVVFTQGKSLVIHRVVSVTNENGIVKYVTKGDANNENDTGYITKNDIVGITSIKISYIGYPTVWLNEIFSK